MFVFVFASLCFVNFLGIGSNDYESHDTCHVVQLAGNPKLKLVKFQNLENVKGSVLWQHNQLCQHILYFHNYKSNTHTRQAIVFNVIKIFV